SNAIGNNGAQALSEAVKTNPTLTTLSLVNNLLGDSGAPALSGALKINSTLTTLELQSNSIRHIGAQALSAALDVNLTLTSLNLEYNLTGDNGAQVLYEALKQLYSDHFALLKKTRSEQKPPLWHYWGSPAFDWMLREVLHILAIFKPVVSL
ncbi:hypothetical protein BG006_005038, partial [Podila minutissima]